MSDNRTRWVIAALLCLATTINYIDRQTLSILSPLLRKELNLSEYDYANIVTAFLAAYTVMYSVGGRVMDALGVRLGLVLSLGWWSIATMLTGFARGAMSLGAFRLLLGIGEPCVYPAGLKECALAATDNADCDAIACCRSAATKRSSGNEGSGRL